MTTQTTPTFKIPVTWEMIGYVYLKADSLEQAVELAKSESLPLPEGSYAEGSFRVDFDA